MKELLGLLCEKSYKLLRRLVFISTKIFDIHTVRTFNLIITYRCNSRCIICDIWRTKNKKFKDISYDKIKQILDASSFKNVRTFVLTGGEPFIRPDLYEIYNFIKQKFPSKKIIISTNGLLRKNILDFLEKIEDKSSFGLIISLDGIKKIDNIRGVKNSLEKILNTIREIKKQFPSIKLFIKFTITPWNHNEILDIYNLSKKENIGFLIKCIDNLNNYTSPLSYKKNEQRFLFNDYKKTEILKQLEKLRFYQLEKLHFRNSAFTRELIEYFSKKNHILSNCTLPHYSVFVMQNGDIYLCRRFESVGNIYKNEFSYIWNSKTAKKVRYSKCDSCVSHYGFYNSFI